MMCIQQLAVAIDFAIANCLVTHTCLEPLDGE